MILYTLQEKKCASETFVNDNNLISRIHFPQQAKLSIVRPLSTRFAKTIHVLIDTHIYNHLKQKCPIKIDVSLTCIKIMIFTFHNKNKMYLDKYSII